MDLGGAVAAPVASFFDAQLEPSQTEAISFWAASSVWAPETNAPGPILAPNPIAGSSYHTGH